MHSTRSLRAFVRIPTRSPTNPSALRIAANRQRFHHAARTPSSLLPRSMRPALPASRTIRIPRCARYESTEASPKPLTNRPDLAPEPAQTRDIPAYEMTFTCKACKTRSTHRVSKQGYHHGTVLIACPGCKARHLISDHLKIFSDKAITLEDILRSKGQLLKRGTLDADSDLELWEDGTETKRSASPTAPETATTPSATNSSEEQRQ